MNKRVPLIVVLLIFAVATGWHLSNIVHRKEGNIDSAMRVQAQPVSVLVLESEIVPLKYSLPGRISAFKQSQVRPQVNGLIAERLFEEGATVKKGQPLYQIDDTRYKATLMSTKADLKSKRSNFKFIEAKVHRYEDLFQIDAVSRQEYEDVQVQLEQANAAVEVADAAVNIAQVNFDYTKVYAPIAGRIGRSLVTEGTLVTANQQQPMAVITQLDPVYVDMQQSNINRMNFHSRMEDHEIPVTLFLDDNKTQPYPLKGRLKFSEVTINEMTGSVILRALVPNPKGVLLPGLFVRTTLDFGQRKVLRVPQRAATRTAKGSLMVWVVDDNNKAQSRSIQVSSAYKDSWIVTSGLKPKERIIVEGYQKVRRDSLVNPVLWKKTSSKISDTKQE